MLAFQHQEIEGHCRGDEREEHEEELALLQQVGAACLKNYFRNLEHGLVRFFFLDHEKLEQADAQRTNDDESAVEEELPCGDCSAEQVIAAGMQIRNRKIRFTGENLSRQRQE